MDIFNTAVGYVACYDNPDGFCHETEKRLEDRIIGMYLRGIDLDDMYIKDGKLRFKNEYV